jgi:hypothetical protein
MFDPMPDETTDRLNQLLKELGSASGLQAASSGTPAPVPAAPAAATTGPLPSVIVSASVNERPPAKAWSPPEGLDATRAMSMDALRTVLAAADAPSPVLSKETSTLKEMIDAALAPPPVPAMAPVTPEAPPEPEIPDTAPRGVPAALASAATASSPGDTRLMVQIRGLLMELGEIQGKLDTKERELADALEKVDRLKAENADLRQKLTQAEDQLWKRDANAGSR